MDGDLKLCFKEFPYLIPSTDFESHLVHFYMTLLGAPDKAQILVRQLINTDDSHLYTPHVSGCPKSQVFF